MLKSTWRSKQFSACEQILVKKSHGNEGKSNLTHLLTLKSTAGSCDFLCLDYLVHEKKSSLRTNRLSAQRAIEESHWMKEGQEREDR